MFVSRHILILSKFFLYSNLDIHRVIICFTIGLCITKKMKKFSAFLHELHRSVQYFFLIKASVSFFGSVPNKVVNIVFFFKTYLEIRLKDV